MPLSIESLGVPALRILASDLGVSDIGTDKATMITSLTEIFTIRGLDPKDVSSISLVKVTVPPPTSPGFLNLHPPSQFDTSEEGRSTRWEAFVKEFEFYAEAIGLADDRRKRSVLLHCAGPNLQSIVDTLVVRPSDHYADLISQLSHHFTPIDVTRFDRFKLYEIFQRPNESTDDFVTRLRQKSRHCKLVCGNCGVSQEDDRLLDVLLRNTCSTQLRRRVFEKGLSSLAEVLAVARSLEAASTQSRQMEQLHPGVSRMEINRTNPDDSRDHTPPKKNEDNLTPRMKTIATPTVRKCLYCAGVHLMQKNLCPAYKKTCSSCNSLNHFARCCRALKERQKSTIHAVDAGDALESDDFVFSIAGRNQILCQLEVSGTPREFLIDTGSSYNIIPRSFLPDEHLLNPAPVVTCYGGAKLKPLGSVKLETCLPGKRPLPVEFLVVEKGQPLLSLQSSLTFGCITLNPDHVFSVTPFRKSQHLCKDLLYSYRTLFEPKLGCIQGVTAKIQLRPDAKPMFCRHRPVPLALQDKVTKALNEMIDRGTLTKVRTSSWASPMVTVPKPDGTVRLCADYTRTLASVIDIESYPLPHPDDLLSSLSGNKVFTKLDLRTCFEQFQLDDVTKEILTVNTIKGLMRYERLPYGISSAPAIVQRAMDDIFQDIDVHIYLDDLLIASPDLTTHLQVLEQVLRKLSDVGARLREDKCEFCVSSVKYLGFIISQDGKEVDPDKLSAILRIQPPIDVSTLRSFLGLVRFYDKFISGLATVAAPLHQLLKKDSKWQWTSSEQSSFDSIKSILTSAPTLVHYDPVKPIILSCDASPFGVGAILSHRFADKTEKPISFASRTLSSSEKNYAHIDKEALAIIYGVNKFEKYLIGRTFTLVTDHKPLQSIFGFRKGLPSTVTARLHRYAVRLSSFDFSIEYRDGVKHSNADALSRAPVDNSEDAADETERCEVACLQNINLRPAVVAEETSNDQTLSLVLANIRGGWCEHCPNDATLEPYWRHRRQLSTGQGIVMLGRRVVVPHSLQTSTLTELHQTHQGIQKMKSLARLHVWWPSIDEQIELLVNTCNSCQQTASSPPIVTHPWPAAHPWERVHLDYGSFNGHDFLVLVDAGSKWIEAQFVHSTTSDVTLKILYSWFSRFGFPQYIHTDGGPQFTSSQFRNKLAQWNTIHSVSPPYHPQSNGMAERGVRFIKEALRKNSSSTSRLEAILFRYRATPLSCGKTPSELLLGYVLRSRIDLTPATQNLISSRKAIYSPDDPVWIRDYRPNSPKWQAATVHKMLGRTIVEVKVYDKLLKRHLNQVRRRISPGT